MAGKHVLQGLIKWSTREPWCDRFEQVLEDHLLPACDETGLEIEDIVATVGKDLFMSTIWACAFEDFVTQEFEDGANVVDDYLKRRGWKESASVRTYISALRNSSMSFYEVSDIVRDKSFRARDLLRGGEPVLISERSATHSLKPWDRLAARVVRVGQQTQMCGGVLPYQHEIAEALIESFHKLAKLTDTEKRKLAAAIDGEVDLAAPLSQTEMLRAASVMLTTFWLVDVIDRAEGPEMPDLHNVEGDELLMCELRYPLTAGTSSNDIEAILEARPEFRRAAEASWNWVSTEEPTRSAGARVHAGKSLTLETRLEDGALALGGLELEEAALVLTVNSKRRCERGQVLLSELFGTRLGPPVLKTEFVEQFMASPHEDMSDQLDLTEQERRTIVHDHMDQHYRKVLDQPVPMLEGKSPRAAVETESGRIKVADWLKMMENWTAQAADNDSAMASYSFRWLWTELGIKELRR